MAKRPAVLVVNNFHAETISKLDQLYDTHKLWLAESEEAADALINRLAAEQCSAVATASWACDRRAYSLPDLKIISCFGVGIDGIDLALAAQRNIRVTNTPDVLNDAVADLAIALLLATHRNLINADNFVRQGKWLQGSFPFSRSLAGRSLGIVGLGNIGEDIVARALPFKLQIAYHNRKPKDLPYTYYSSIEALAANSDILLCMLPGGADTRNVISAKVFEQLGPDGVFINLGRGSVVDETALIAALHNGTIAGAGLDVYQDEPRVPQALLVMPNVVLFPHIGSATVETRRAMGQLVLDNLAAYFHSV